MATDTEDRAKAQADIHEGQAVRPMRAEDHTSASPAEQTPIEGRQGFLGRPVFMVLIAALVLAVVAGIVVGYLPI